MKHILVVVFLFNNNLKNELRFFDCFFIVFWGYCYVSDCFPRFVLKVFRLNWDCLFTLFL